MTVCNMLIEAGARAGMVAPGRRRPTATWTGPPLRAAGRALGAGARPLEDVAVGTPTRCIHREVSLDAADIAPTVKNPPEGLTEPFGRLVDSAVATRPHLSLARRSLFLPGKLKRHVDQLARNPQAEGNHSAEGRLDGIEESRTLATPRAPSVPTTRMPSPAAIRLASRSSARSRRSAPSSRHKPIAAASPASRTRSRRSVSTGRGRRPDVDP